MGWLVFLSAFVLVLGVCAWIAGVAWPAVTRWRSVKPLPPHVTKIDDWIGEAGARPGRWR